MSTQTYLGTLELIECYKCNTIFGMSPGLMKRCREQGQDFYCPNGHCQHFTKSEVQRLKDQLAAAAREKEYLTARVESNRSRADRAERRVTAYKGQVTRIKNRVGKGVCPCCNRTFQNLARHMETQHPDFSKSEA